MKYAIVTSSKTGNTKRLAEAIKEALKNDELIYEGESPIQEEGSLQIKENADVIFAGFWTDKGSCTEEMQEFLASLEHKKLFLFGTAGFGGGEEYFTQILTRVKTNLSDTNEVIGEFMCQGRMPMGIRSRYETMSAQNPSDEKFTKMIENFDQALSHPSEDDLISLKAEVTKSIG